MNIRLLTTFLCLTVASTGCIIVDNGGGGPCCNGGGGGGGGGYDPGTPSQPQKGGDVTFLWTFGSIGTGRCLDVPDIKSIRISIPGEKLHNGGVYACNTAGTDGIVLHDFLAGNYPYTLEAVDYNGKVVYTASGSFTINGNKTVNVDFTPPGKNQSFAYLSWSFEANTSSPNPSCAQAGVTHVDVRIDGAVKWTRLTCESGLGSKQVASDYLEPGEHTIEYMGVNVSGTTELPYYYRSGKVTTTKSAPVSASFTLREVGGIALRWAFIDGSLGKSCAEAGVSHVLINLRDVKTDALLYGDAGIKKDCKDPSFIDRFVPPGDYTVYVRGINSAAATLYSNENSNPPTLTVKGRVQKTEADATTIYTRKQTTPST